LLKNTSAGWIKALNKGRLHSSFLIKMFKNQRNKAFIFIEPLLLFSGFVSVGLLAFFFLASVGEPVIVPVPDRDARIRANLSMTRVSAEMYSFEQGNYSYDNMCANPDIIRLLDDISATAGEKPFCQADGENYCVSSRLASDHTEYVCVSSMGAMGQIKCTSADTECK